jgi:ubiquinone/menaquinone biosynthesis C-methylase UbiE
MNALNSDLGLLCKLFDLDGIANEKIDSHSVSKYYHWTNWLYRQFHSREGAMHFPLYLPGHAKNHFEGLGEQARLIDIYTKPEYHVVEIGCGSGYNLRQLLKIKPTLTCVGVDPLLKHVRQAIRFVKREGYSQVTFKQGKFHCLPLANSSVDIVFAVESFCYSENLVTDLMEVNRVLKVGGLFIVFDLFRQPRFDEANASIQLASKLTANGFAIAQWQKIDLWLHAAKSAGFQVHQVDELSEAIAPNLARLQKDSRSFFKRIAKLPFVSAFIPSSLLKHIITGLLSPHLMTCNAHGYFQIVLRRMI